MLWIAATDCTLIRWHAMHMPWWTSSRRRRRRRHVQHIFRDKETTEERKGWRGWAGKGWIIRCLLHSAPSDTDATLSCLPCRPSAADSVIHNVRRASASDICTPVLFPRKNFYRSFPGILFTEFFRRAERENTLTLSREDKTSKQEETRPIAKRKKNNLD